MSSLQTKSNKELSKLYVALTQEMHDRGMSFKSAYLEDGGMTDKDYPLALLWRECMLYYFHVKMTGGRSYLRMWEYLLRKFGKPVTKSGVLDFCYYDRPNDMPEEKIVDVYVCHFRRMLKKIPGEPFMIETIWGTGHKLRFTDTATALENGVSMDEEVIRSIFADLKAHKMRAEVEAEGSAFDDAQVDLRKQLDKRSVAA